MRRRAAQWACATAALALGLLGTSVRAFAPSPILFGSKSVALRGTQARQSRARGQGPSAAVRGLHRSQNVVTPTAALHTRLFRAYFPGAAPCSTPWLGWHGSIRSHVALGTAEGNQEFVLDVFDPEEEEDELANEKCENLPTILLLEIIYSQTTDQAVNDLVWKCLGYKKDASGEWNNDDVFPKWREKYPYPPDLIGVQRNYTYDIDRPVQKANQQLVASIPQAHKQGVKLQLRPLGFTGFMLDELTPNKTRRAQCVNWLIFYRDALRGKSLAQLKEEQEARRADEAPTSVMGPNSRRGDESTMIQQDKWKYPQKPVV